MRARARGARTLLLDVLCPRARARKELEAPNNVCTTSMVSCGCCTSHARDTWERLASPQSRDAAA